MSDPRVYQSNFSALYPAAGDRESRLRKARTIASVLADHFGGTEALRRVRLLDVGASTGAIDAALATQLAEVVGIDIDADAIAAAQREQTAPNLRFVLGDAMALDFPDASFDAVLCAHVYEHVPDAARLMAEIRRVLKPGGICYFAAGNRYQPVEPHYRLPLLSVMPKALAHRYLQVLGRGTHYYEQHLSYWGLRALVRDFRLTDYSRRIIDDPERYATDYMLPAGSWKRLVARLAVRIAYPFLPTYIWLLHR